MSASSLITTTSQASASPRVRTLSTSAQHLAILCVVLLLSIAVPAPERSPGAWLWDIGAVLLACALVFSRRRQPHIDDRDLDRILGVGGLLSALWIVAEWDAAYHPTASVMAASSLAFGLLFWVIGTRETSWLAPAILPVLLGSRTDLSGLLPGVVGLIACAGVGAAVAWRRGAAPQGQFDVLRPTRLIAPTVAALAVLVVARGWIA